VWLAPPDKQVAMRHAAWWSILWTDRIVELPLDAPIWYLGEQAINALELRAPRCTVSEWIFDFPIFKEKIPRWEWPQLFEKFNLVHLPFEHFVAGGILRQLIRDVGPSSRERLQFPRKAPPDELLFRSINAGIEEGLEALKKQLGQETGELMKLVENNFRVLPGRGKA
jgi:hypothetical protein